MIRLDKIDRSMEIALALKKALDSDDIVEAITKCIPAPKTTVGTMGNIRRVIKNKGSMTFELAQFIDTGAETRYEVVIDFGTKELHVRAISDSIDLHGVNFQFKHGDSK